MKNIVLALSFLGIAIMMVTRNAVALNICDQLDYECRTILDKVENILYFAPIVLLFSLLTYKMPDRVFATWWKFARFAVPMILFVSWLISLELHHNPGGFFNMDQEFDLLGIMLMYSIFIVGSLIQIYRGYR